MQITPEMMRAWADLQGFAKTVRKYVNATSLERAVSDAIDVLDDSDFMVPIEEAANEAETAAQFAAADPAEWGDTTAEDMARHQGLDVGREAIVSERMFRP